MYEPRLRGAREPCAARRLLKLIRLVSVEGIDPYGVGPGAPLWSVNGDDAEPFHLRRIAPSPFLDFGKFDRRLGEPVSDPAQRRRGAGDEGDGVDRRALDPHFVLGNLDIVNAGALARVEFAGLQ